MAVSSILVFVDQPEGGLDETGRGLLSYCARLAANLQADWAVVTLHAPTEVGLAEFGAYGTPGITRLESSKSLQDTPVLLGQQLAEFVRGAGADLVLLPHNDLGATLAPLLAAGLDGGLMTEVTSARSENDSLRLSRSVLGDRLAETRTWDGNRPMVMTVPVRVLSQVLLPSVKSTSPRVETWGATRESAVPVAKVISRIPPDPQTVDLVDAEVIFSAGKGCSEATFAQMQELCRLLNVSYGVTRPVYDLGWTGFERMVGQTGRTVTPRFYLALGISGSMHHVGGIKDSKRIVAINLDPKAPIFPNVDEGFVADLGEVLPILLEKARAACGGEA